MSRIAARTIDFGVVRTEFGLGEDYPEAAVQEARDASDSCSDQREDRTDLALVTIDPPTSMDLDQAVHIARTDTGFVVSYAIADVGAMVVPGSALDQESRRRGQTFYLPDGSLPLHPRELSEGSASLLPELVRAAALWTIELDRNGETVRFDVRRATVRSVARFDYEGVQAAADAGTLHPSIEALPDVGRLRSAIAAARGAIELKLPDQEVVEDDTDGSWRLVLHPHTKADDWNAQISLLTGMCAASLMIEAKVGLLRTLPPAESDALASIRRTAAALGIEWQADRPIGALLAELDPNAPTTLVLMTEATTLLRGAGYAAFDGELPELTVHSGIGAPYAHVTAPLRRLSDRFSTEVCLAASAGTEIPAWARTALADLADVMRASDSQANKVDRACIDLTEAVLLAHRVGQRFAAVVVREADGKRDAEIFVEDPPVLAKCTGEPPEGASVQVELATADVRTRVVSFAYRS